MNKTVKVAKHMNIQKIKKCPHGLRPSQSLGPSSYSSFSPVLVFTSQSAHLQLHSMRKLPPGFPLLVSSVITIHLACFVFFFKPGLISCPHQLLSIILSTRINSQSDPPRSGSYSLRWTCLNPTTAHVAKSWLSLGHLQIPCGPASRTTSACSRYLLLDLLCSKILKF